MNNPMHLIQSMMPNAKNTDLILEKFLEASKVDNSLELNEEDLVISFHKKSWFSLTEYNIRICKNFNDFERGNVKEPTTNNGERIFKVILRKGDGKTLKADTFKVAPIRESVINQYLQKFPKGQSKFNTLINTDIYDYL